MAAFPYDKHHSFLLDSSLMFLIPDETTNMSCFSEHYMHKPCFPPQQHHPFYDQADPTVKVLPSVNMTHSTSTTKIFNTCNSNTVTAQYHQVNNPMEKIKNNYLQPHYKVKGKKPRKETTCSTIDEEKLNNKRSRRSGNNDKKKKKNMSEERNGALTGYVHVRARRGQASDSHSLAERARRKKISERMKLLQAIVPGCDQVTSKAHMLDEIINYVQSLQYQVEFLSLKIASVDPMLYDYGMNVDAFMVKPQSESSNGQLFSDVDEQRPKTIYPSCFTNNLYSSLHLL